MTSWPTAALGDLCEINIGRTPSRSRPEYWGPSTPWLSIADMNQGIDIVSTKETITDLAVAEATAKRVDPGTVLFSFKLSIGKVGIPRRPIYTNEAIAALPVKPGVALHPEYLLRVLEAMNFSGDSNRAAMGATLNKAQLHRIVVPVPPLDGQRRIGAILDHAAALQAKSRETMASFDLLAQAVFIERFGDPLRNPRGYAIRTLAEIVDPRRPITYGILTPGPHQPAGIPYVRVLDLASGTVTTSALRRTTTEIARPSRYRSSAGARIGVHSLPVPADYQYALPPAIPRIHIIRLFDAPRRSYSAGGSGGW